MNRQSLRLFLSILLFIVILGAGLWLSLRKPLWTDEIFSQITSVEGHTYGQMLAGDLNGEDNVCPLFYIIQKAVTDAAHYQFPFQWDGTWSVIDFKGQIIMRLPAVISMALALGLLFAGGLARFGRTGLWGVGLALTSFSAWIYITEARPYPLWFLLSTLHAFFVWDAVKNPCRRIGIRLCVVQCLLSLTIIFGIVQVASAAFVLWPERRRLGRWYGLSVGLPVMMTAFYLTRSSGLSWWSWNSSGQAAAVSAERVLHTVRQLRMALPIELLAGWIGYGIFLGIHFLKNFRNGLKMTAVTRYWVYFGGLIFSAVLICVMMVFLTRRENSDYAVLARYFVFLTPAALLWTTVMIRDVWERCGTRTLVRMNIVLFLIGIVWIRLLQTGLHLIYEGYYG